MAFSILTALPLFPYLEITVTPLATHPSSLAANPTFEAVDPAGKA